MYALSLWSQKIQSSQYKPWKSAVDFSKSWKLIDLFDLPQIYSNLSDEPQLRVQKSLLEGGSEWVSSQPRLT